MRNNILFIGITAVVFGLLILFLLPSLFADIVPVGRENTQAMNAIFGPDVQFLFSIQTMQIFGGILVTTGIGTSILSAFPSFNKNKEFNIDRGSGNINKLSIETPIRIVSTLDINILNLISNGVYTLDSLFMRLKVDKSIIANKLTELYVRGFISENNYLTQKGYEYLNNFQ